MMADLIASPARASACTRGMAECRPEQKIADIWTPRWGLRGAGVISTVLKMGRGGIEPPTHGFSDQIDSSQKCGEQRDLENGGNDGAAMALHFGSEVQEIINSWPRLTDAQKASVMGIVRSQTKGER
jgi:hypothetical protein